MATVARSRIDFENNPTASKPANLANSAVLRMLEEEEEEQRRSGSNPDGGRRSRSRYREIDRDTVLRINRHRPRRQFSWPPKVRSQSARAAGGGVKGERRDLSLDSKLSHVDAAGATIAEDLSALQQRGEVAQQRRKGCLPPPKPRRQPDNKSPAYRDGRGSIELDASHTTRARWHQNSAKSQRINSRPKASDSGASVNLDPVQAVPRLNDSPPSNDWHSSADTHMVYTVIETPVYCLFCAAKDCLCPRREPLDLSEMEALAEVSRRIVAEGEEELAREKEAQELDAAIRELIDFASVVRKRPEIMNPAYIPIVEGCLQELAMLAMLHSQGRIGLRPETPRGATIEELIGNSSQSAAAPDTGICRNLPKLSDDLVGDNHNKREGRESSTEALFATERFIPTEGLRRVAWPPPSDVTVHPSQVPLHTNNHQSQSQQQYQPVAPASAPAPVATSFQNQYQTQSYQTSTSYQATETQQQQYYQPQVRQQSPGVITLRTELPVSQVPAPVYASQPPVFSYKGGCNMRGDQKWPPQEYKQQAVEENEARLRLAAGPACRPRRANKDYTAFFAKNALSHNYPGYRVPPGTQHVNGQSMM